MQTLEAKSVYKQLLVVYLLFQEWKKLATAQVGAKATTRELMYMFDVFMQPGLSAGQYAKLSMVTPGTYTSTQRSLTRKKLIHVVRPTGDNRVRLIKLTELGTQTVLANLAYFQKLIQLIEREQGAERARDFMATITLSERLMREKMVGHLPSKPASRVVKTRKSKYRKNL